METQWYNRQLEVGKSLVQQGSQALRNNDFNTANAAFAEATVVLDMAEEDTIDVKKLRAQVMNETGFILQRAGRTDGAVANHRRAAELCAELLEAGEEFRANAAATNINLAGLLAGIGNFAEARAASEVALRHATALAQDGVDPDQTSNLLFGANQNHAMILARSGAWKGADEALTESMDLVEVVAANNKAVYAQAAQGCQQMSVLMFHDENYEGALKWGRRAEDFSEKAYNEVGEQMLGVYVTSQINLISFFEKMGQLADAESALYKALDVVGPHPQILLRGKDFYAQCRKLDDSKLIAGDLPRDEVDDGYADLMTRIDEIGGEEKLMEIVQQAEQQAAAEQAAAQGSFPQSDEEE